jgi:signal transduction histidine kinase
MFTVTAAAHVHRALVVASGRDARKSIRETLESSPGVEVLSDVSDIRRGTLKASRLHPDLIVVAVSPDDDIGWALPGLLGVAPGARIVLTLLEEWTTRPPKKGSTDVHAILEVLREARTADDGETDGRRREGTLSMLAHDILTPATAIIGVADLLLRYWERFDERERKEAVTNISRVGRDLASLVKSVVRAASADAGSLVGDREPVSVRELLEVTVEGIGPVAPSHHFELSIASRVPRVWIDRIRVQEAVLNFLTNAVKYSPAGTTVRVAAESIQREVRITVTDEGPGIPLEDQHRLFKKFSRLQPDDDSGHGLGLYLVKSIIEAHGGRVWVDAEPGRGSTFGFALPATGRTRSGRNARRVGIRV